MTIRYLLDTNTVSEPVRERPNRQLVARFHRHQFQSAIAAPVWHELRFGTLRMPASKRRTLLEAYLRETVERSLPILAYDDEAAEHHARERARLIGRGLTPPYLDSQIAAIAYVHNLVVVTSNVSDFQHFEDVDVVDWRA